MNYEFDYGVLLDPYYFRRLVSGVETTLLLFAVCVASAFAIALILVAMRSSSRAAVRVPAQAFVEFQRNVPLLVHLLLWYFGVASLLPAPVLGFANDHGAEFVFAAITLGLYGGAFMSEDLRSGLRAVAAGQYESARSLGLSFFQMLRLVVVPQAFRNALPAVVNQSLSLFKNTSIAAAIGVGELMYRTRDVTTETFRVLEAFSVATAVYFAGSILLVGAGALLVRRLAVPGMGAR